METCDVCKLVFTSAAPNKAVADAKIRGLGVWGYVCDGHWTHGVPGTITKLPVEEETHV
jgi:hypothetical protein